MSDGKTLGTIVGGVLGFFTGGLGYVAVGAALGGFAGGLLDPQSTSAEPQRLEDLKVSVSTYGAGIPETWGNDIPPGTWIWTTDIQEVPQYYGSGGKGGGNDGPSSYFYLVHGLICLGRAHPGKTPVIRKVYKDGKLVYDLSSGMPIAQALASEENPFVGIQVLDGSESQLPPAFIEIWEGAGNVPGYRGLVTALIVGLETPGGRIPQLSFELCYDAFVGVEAIDFGHVDAKGLGAPAWGVVRSEGAWHYNVQGADFSGDLSLNVTYVGPGYTSEQRPVSYPGVHYMPAPGVIPVGGDGDPCALRARGPAGASRTEPWYIDLFNLQTGAITQIYEYTPGSGGDIVVPSSAAYHSGTEKFAFIGGTGPNANTPSIINHGVRTLCGQAVEGAIGPIAINEVSVFVLSRSAGNLLLTRYSSETGDFIAAYLGPTQLSNTMAWAALHVSDDGIFAWARDTGIYNLYRVDLRGAMLSTWNLIHNQVDTIPPEKLANHATTISADSDRALIGPSNEDDLLHYYTYYRFHVVNLQGADVAEIIEDQALRVDLSSGQIDLSTIDDSIHGYTFNKSPASARSNIAPLLTYSGAAMVEEDGLIRFFHRGDKAPGPLIPWLDLGCVEDGQDPGDPAPLTRQQEAECPRSLTVSYNNPAFDYQISTEQVRRLTTDSQFDEQVDLALVMSSDRAATIAHRLMYERWAARNARSAKISRKYADISPGDVRPLEYREGTVGNFMAVKVTDTGALVEIDWIPADAELLLQTVPGSQGYQEQEIAPLPAPLQQRILDIPILRDADNNAGIYVAIDSLASVPAKGQLYVGQDDNTLEARGAVSASAPIGFTESALAAASPGFVDETNLVTINVGPEELASVTRDVLLAGGAEYWAIGAPGRWEIGASAQIDDLGGGRFILSRHLRGLFGTEIYAGSHQKGDVVVMLRSVGMLRPVNGVGDLGQEKSYRAVAAGRRFDSSKSARYTNTGEGLKPLSPINLRRTDGNDLTIDRRSRLSMNFATGAVPLGEAVEAYLWRFFSNNTYATQLAAISTTVPTVTAAQMTAAGITPTSTLYVRVAQLSDSVGEGHQLQGAA